MLDYEYLWPSLQLILVLLIPIAISIYSISHCYSVLQVTTGADTNVSYLIYKYAIIK